MKLKQLANGKPPVHTATDMIMPCHPIAVLDAAIVSNPAWCKRVSGLVVDAIKSSSNPIESITALRWRQDSIFNMLGIAEVKDAPVFSLPASIVSDSYKLPTNIRVTGKSPTSLESPIDRIRDVIETVFGCIIDSSYDDAVMGIHAIYGSEFREDIVDLILALGGSMHLFAEICHDPKLFPYRIDYQTYVVLEDFDFECEPGTFTSDADVFEMHKSAVAHACRAVYHAESREKVKGIRSFFNVSNDPLYSKISYIPEGIQRLAKLTNEWPSPPTLAEVRESHCRMREIERRTQRRKI